MHQARTAFATGAAALAVAAVVGTGSSPAATVARAAAVQGGAALIVNGATFDHPHGNPWFPLRPGTTTVLRGSDEGQHFRERVRVTHRTRSIQGVTTHA